MFEQRLEQGEKISSEDIWWENAKSLSQGCVGQIG